MIDAAVSLLSKLLQLIPDRLPGKGRLGRLLLRPIRSRTPAILKDSTGCTYVLPSYAEPIAQHLFTFGAYERDTQNTILQFLSESGAFIDVGANVGALALPIAKSRPYVSILCIEADPRIYRVLQENVARNGCGNIKIISCVSGPTDGPLVKFYPAPDESFGMGSLGPQFCSEPIMLKQRSLDSVLADMDICGVDVVKIDVEGAEVGVLRGAQRLLACKRPPAIIFEFADWAEARIPGQKPGDAQALLLAAGYQIFQLDSPRAGERLVEPMCRGSAMLLALPPHLQPTYPGPKR